MHATIRVASLLVLSAAFIGCSGESEPIETGEVKVQWHVGARGCADVGAATIEVRSVGTGREVGPWTFDCNDRVGVLADLAPGTWRFELDATDSEGVGIFGGDTGEVVVRPEGITVVPTVVLEAAPAVLTVEWNFGGPLCAQVGVEEIEVLAFDPWGSVENRIEVPCNDGIASFEIRPGDYDVAIHGLNSTGAIVYAQLLDVSLTQGESAIESLALSPVE
jgi:hypothetical protein